VLCLGLANNDSASLAYLTEIAEDALKAEPPDADASKIDEQDSEYALLRSALIALCARDDSNEVLLTILNVSPEARIRETAARTLSLRRDRSAVAGIARTLGRSDRYTWLEITNTLEPLLNADDSALISRMLEHSKNTVRAGAVWIFARHPEIGADSQTRLRLIAALNDDSSLVRYYAAESLGKRNVSAALEALVKALDDIDDEVRAAAAQAIGEIGDKEACIAVANAAPLQYRIDARWFKALAISGEQKYAEVILKLANSNLYMEQRAGLEALAASNQPAARERLLKAFRSDDEPLQTVAANLLAQRRRAAIVMLREDLESPDKAARARAYHLLAYLDSKAKSATLKAALAKEEDPNLKALIEWALERKPETER
jgi:HEAT repeat protein